MNIASQNNDRIETLQRMLDDGRDSALLRFSLGTMLVQNNRIAEAIEHLEVALQHNPDYSAAHKLLAKALAESGDTDRAIAAYETGIQAAQGAGDKQAEKEMRVFLRRLQKAQ